MRIAERDLPVLFDGDAVIVGGSFAAVSAAVQLAQSGKKVALVESRTYLGREVTATLRPWLDGYKEEQQDFLPELLKEVARHGTDRDEEMALYMDQVKVHLEDVLMDEGVKLLYASFPTSLSTDQNGKKLLVIGNKSGRQIMKADIVIDTTETGSVLRIAGETFESRQHLQGGFYKTIELDRVDEIKESKLKVPEHLGIVDNTLWVHQGYREQGHVLLEFMISFDREDHDDSIEASMKREIQSRHTMMVLAEYLIQHHQAFHQAYFATTSYELHGIHSQRAKTSIPSSLMEKLNHPIQLTSKAGQQLTFTLSNFVSADSRVWCLTEAIRIEQGAEHFLDPVSSSILGQEVAKHITLKWEELLDQSAPSSPYCDEEKIEDITTTYRNESDVIHLDDSKWKLAELKHPQEGKEYERQSVPSMDIPVLHHTDILVVGGGTSGATAAITSAKEGMDTVLLEMNPGLGGTATHGGVDSYWFGRRIGFNARVTELVDDIHQKINHRNPKWNVEGKMYALLQEAEKVGVQTYFHTITVGTIMEDHRVRGVIVVTRWGMYAILAETVIDASGDGDVAVAAGADYVYGSERDHVVMWYSLAQFSNPGRSQNNFTSAVDISNVEDYTRAILEGRRRKRKKECHDHGVYVASRETRHVLGEEVMTLTDQLRHRQWEDVINIHFSNHDMKGKNGADWMHLGLIPPNLEIEVPYRMLLPKKIDGILIAGKAISATHDAFAAIRMQSDLENLGGIIALAAVQAISDHKQPRDIDIKKLQKRLVQEGLLPKEVLHRTVRSMEYNDEELVELVDSLTGEQPLYMYADMEMDEVFKERIPIVEVCTVGPRVIPILEKALDKARKKEDTGRQIVLAQALAMYESSYGVPVLIDEIEKELSIGELPARDNAIGYTQLPPDHGAMPDVAYLIYSLGMAKDKNSLPIWDMIADLIEPTEENFKDMFKGTFYYVDAVCYGIERLADSEGIPILEKFYAHQNLSNQLRISGVEPDYFKERQAMLELCIARALARCGSKKGYTILISYLEDTRALLAEQAHTELKNITGQDYHKNIDAWKSYLESVQHSLQPQPLRQKLDIDTEQLV